MNVQRSELNPILKPSRVNAWEGEAVFNGCPALFENKVFLLYRALSVPHYHALAKTKLRVSDIGIAQSEDGVRFSDRKRFVFPEHEWEKFGCEDPRVTFFEGKFYIFYTAISTYPFGPDGIKAAVAISKDLKTIDEKHLVTPFNAKGMTIFPDRINGKIWALISVNTDRPPSSTCLVSFDSIEAIWNHEKWNDWYQNYTSHALNLQLSDKHHIEVGAPPIKTDEGWLVIYSYIKDYFTSNPLFTIEAVLLETEDPTKIKARTKTPLLVPEEYYEMVGMVSNIVFPTGAYIKDGIVNIHYGAADTMCCIATVRLDELLKNMLGNGESEVKLTRSEKNPILIPKKENAWESLAVFNPAAICLHDKVHIVYRAMGQDNTSVFGYATSSDGETIDYKSQEPIYIPRESFELKLVGNGNSGCEDPRLTLIDDKIYMCYTAYDTTNPPRVAMSSISVVDFVENKWNWSKPVLVSPPNIDDKDAFVFPQKINGKFIFVHRTGEDMDYTVVSDLEFKEEEWLEETRWIMPRRGWWDGKKVGAAAPPVLTPEGWLMLYHGVSDDSVYRVGAVLLDSKDPFKVLARTDYPIFEPETEYELSGIVNNVVFPCGYVILKDYLYMYYGGGDKVIGVAKIKTETIMNLLKDLKIS